jgi:hypothetical protein
MSKSSATRLTETINYLRGVDAGLADQVTVLLVRDGRGDQIGDEIKLEGRTGLFDAISRNNTETQRDALRALLLCQRLYLSAIWTRRFGDKPTHSQATWPEATFHHFRAMPEEEIRNAIRMYTTVRSATKATFANAAQWRSRTPDNFFTARRGGGNPPVGGSCYDQVSHWLLHAGFVSLRWMYRYSPNEYDLMGFGPGVEWITRSTPTPPGPFLIERGMIIRMYTARRPGGHFMVSAGGGWGWGYNNTPQLPGDGEGQVTNGHARCLIHRQFASYREPTDQVGPNNFGGILVLLDPSLIPHRC